MSISFCDNCENCTKINIRSDKGSNMICIVCKFEHELAEGNTMIKPQNKPNEADVIAHKIAYMDELKYVRKINEKCRSPKCDGDMLSCMLIDNIKYIYKCDLCKESFKVNI